MLMLYKFIQQQPFWFGTILPTSFPTSPLIAASHVPERWVWLDRMQPGPLSNSHPNSACQADKYFKSKLPPPTEKMNYILCCVHQIHWLKLMGCEFSLQRFTGWRDSLTQNLSLLKWLGEQRSQPERETDEGAFLDALVTNLSCLDLSSWPQTHSLDTKQAFFWQTRGTR